MNLKVSIIDNSNGNRMRIRRNSLLWSLLAICIGMFCICEYLHSYEKTGLLIDFLAWGSRLLAKYAYSYTTEVYNTQTLHYLNVLVWLLPAWILLSLGLVSFARIAWNREVVNLLSRYSTCIVIILALIVFLCSFMINTFVLEQEPITEGDEYCYTFQAKLFATGRLYGTAGADMEEFNNRAIITTGPRRYAIGFPGHPLILSLGFLAGKMNLAPPLLAGISVILLYFIANSFFSKGTAIIAAILMVSSPFYLMFHGTLLPQSSLIPCLLLFLLCVVRMMDNWKWYWLLTGAIALILATCIRPQSVMLFAGPICCYLLLVRALSLRRRVLIGVVCVIAVLIGIIALCVFSSLTSGQPLSLTLSPRPPGGEPYSSGLGFYNKHEHTPIKGLVNTAKALIGWNYYLFGWPISFLPIFVWVFKRGKSGWEYVFVVSAICYYGFYFFFHGPGWHYYLDTVPLLAMISACAFNRGSIHNAFDHRYIHLKNTHHCEFSAIVTNESVIREATQVTKNNIREVPHLFHMLLIVGVLLSLFSWPSSIAYLRNRSAPVRDVSEAIRKANINNAIVLLDDNLPDEMYSAIGRNSPDLDDDVILARKLPSNKWHRTIALFPDRSVWIIRMDAKNQLLCLPYRQDDGVETETDQENGGTAKEESRRVESYGLFQD